MEGGEIEHRVDWVLGLRHHLQLSCDREKTIHPDEEASWADGDDVLLLTPSLERGA